MGTHRNSCQNILALSPRKGSSSLISFSSPPSTPDIVLTLREFAVDCLTDRSCWEEELDISCSFANQWASTKWTNRSGLESCNSTSNSRRIHGSNLRSALALASRPWIAACKMDHDFLKIRNRPSH
jgi:hypothetical protein